MIPKTIWPAVGIAAALGMFQPLAQASLIVVDSPVPPTNPPPNANAVASGRVVDGVDVANWTLTATVSGTADFDNQAVLGGAQGLQYQMTYGFAGTATNAIDFTVSPLAGYEATGLTISQSPYTNSSNTFNGAGGGPIIAQFVLNWIGGGLATIADPDDQLSGLITGSTIASGTTVSFNGLVLNNVDTWSIAIPGTATAQVIWSPPPPNGGRLNNEWVTFNPSVTKRQDPPIDIPLPGTLFLLGAGLIVLRRVTRRN